MKTFNVSLGLKFELSGDEDPQAAVEELIKKLLLYPLIGMGAKITVLSVEEKQIIN